MLQVCRLQQDNRQLGQQLQRLRHFRSANGGESTDDKLSVCEYSDQQGFVAADELRAARSRLDELSWELDERNGEVATLTARIEAAESRIGGLDAELAEVRRKATEAVERANDADRRAAAAERERRVACEEVDRLRVEFDRIKVMADQERLEFEREHDRWLDEKRRVIDYQKKLQLNYVQMARKNRILESDVEQLTAEIERHVSTGSPQSEADEVGRGFAVKQYGKAAAVSAVANESLC